MNLYILNQNFEIIGYMDSYESLEWVTRYSDEGEFVLSTINNKDNFELLAKRNYIARDDCEQICIIEKINIITDIEKGNRIKVEGKSIESILGRRIIYKQTVSNYGETAEQFIRRLVDENCINPTELNRKIPNLKLGKLNGFTEQITIQKTGDNLLTAIKEICKTFEYGFKITMNENQELIFDLYKGTDRSYDQTINPYVVFSNEFENLLNAEYECDESNYCNMALIAGEGEGTARKTATLGNEKSGLDRYELYVDANDISSNEGEINIDQYNNLLIERGKEKLQETMITEVLSGETDSTKQFIYKKDFFLGDIVHVENGYQSNPRIIEIVESKNQNGFKIVPQFGAWEVQ